MMTALSGRLGTVARARQGLKNWGRGLPMIRGRKEMN